VAVLNVLLESGMGMGEMEVEGLTRRVEGGASVERGHVMCWSAFRLR
jgi:hypothetical protein